MAWYQLNALSELATPGLTLFGVAPGQQLLLKPPCTLIIKAQPVYLLVTVPCELECTQCTYHGRERAHLSGHWQALVGGAAWLDFTSLSGILPLQDGEGATLAVLHYTAGALLAHPLREPGYTAYHEELFQTWIQVEQQFYQQHAANYTELPAWTAQPVRLMGSDRLVPKWLFAYATRFNPQSDQSHSALEYAWRWAKRRALIACSPLKPTWLDICHEYLALLPTSIPYVTDRDARREQLKDFWSSLLWHPSLSHVTGDCEDLVDLGLRAFFTWQYSDFDRESPLRTLAEGYAFGMAVTTLKIPTGNVRRTATD